MKFNYKLATAVTALMLAVTSCSDNDNNWEPGPEDNPANGTIVYFEQLDKYSYRLEADDDHVIPVTVSRDKYDAAVSIPLTVTSCPEGVELPDALDFEAGQKSITINIDCNGMPSKTSGQVKMAIDPAYTSIYCAGSPELVLDVEVTGAWIPLAEDIRVRFPDSNYDEIRMTLYVLEGTTQFKFPDFLNSGVDFVFTLGELQSNGRRFVIPTKNFVYVEGAEEDGDWEFYDDKTASYPVAYPNVGGLGITYMSFYGGDYNYFNFTNTSSGSGYFYYVWCGFEDGSASYLTIRFSSINLLFDPFEAVEP